MMVDTQLRLRGIRDERVLDAMARVPRHRFVREADAEMAYGDHPISVGYGQTISQPYIVAYMTEALALPAGARVLEVGTGSGYQTAVLAELAGEVYTIEIVPELAEQSIQSSHVARLRERARAVWRRLCRLAGMQRPLTPSSSRRRLTIFPRRCSNSWPSAAGSPFPSGRGDQELIVFVKTPEGLKEHSRLPVRFVPLTRSH